MCGELLGGMLVLHFPDVKEDQKGIDSLCMADIPTRSGRSTYCFVNM